MVAQLVSPRAILAAVACEEVDPKLGTPHEMPSAKTLPKVECSWWSVRSVCCADRRSRLSSFQKSLVLLSLFSFMLTNHHHQMVVAFHF